MSFDSIPMTIDSIPMRIDSTQMTIYSVPMKIDSSQMTIYSVPMKIDNIPIRSDPDQLSVDIIPERFDIVRMKFMNMVEWLNVWGRIQDPEIFITIRRMGHSINIATLVHLNRAASVKGLTISMMNNKSFILLMVLIIFRIFPAFSQPSDLYSFIRMKHGLDQNLVNGILYYDRYKNVLNHPFYSEEGLRPGSVVISGTRHEDVEINYDIYSQNVILKYSDFSGNSYNIIISPEHTDAFEFDGNYFEKLSLDDRGPLFYQLIEVSGLTCYIHWQKKRTTRSYQFTEYFTEPEQRCFLNYYGKVSHFSKRRDFVNLISGVTKKEINSYIRRKAIKLSDATPGQLEDLLQFISSGIHSTTGN